MFAIIDLPHLHFLWFQGAYVNIDEFKSKFRVLSAKFGKPGQPVRHVFNHDLLQSNRIFPCGFCNGWIMHECVVTLFYKLQAVSMHATISYMQRLIVDFHEALHGERYNYIYIYTLKMCNRRLLKISRCLASCSQHRHVILIFPVFSHNKQASHAKSILHSCEYRYPYI